MSGYLIVKLDNLLATDYGEDAVSNALSVFSCPLNPDVELFIKQKSIVFEKQGISRTYLVYASYKKEYVLAGYFTLANKFISVHRDALPSKTLKKRLAKFSQFDREQKRYMLSAPLIAQLSKNFSNGYESLISGDELLQLALTEIRKMQMIVGGKFAYLECEDIPSLIDFYLSNGFVCFGKRHLDKEEINTLSGSYLLQMMKYL